jgi:hypothetical protein
VINWEQRVIQRPWPILRRCPSISMHIMGNVEYISQDGAVSGPRFEEKSPECDEAVALLAKHSTTVSDKIKWKAGGKCNACGNS